MVEHALHAAGLQLLHQHLLILRLQVSLEIAPQIIGDVLHQRRVTVQMPVDLLLAAIQQAGLQAKEDAAGRQQQEVQLEQPVMPALAPPQPTAALQLQRQQQAANQAQQDAEATVAKQR